MLVRLRLLHAVCVGGCAGGCTMMFDVRACNARSVRRLVLTGFGYVDILDRVVSVLP